MQRRFLIAFAAVAVLTAIGVGGSLSASAARPPAERVLLLSGDGLHQSDLDWYVATHPSSALAQLVHRGVDFTNAQTPFPSDSFPGMVGQVTGGNPRTTGIYYDDTWDHSMFPAGTTDCSGPPP